MPAIVGSRALRLRETARNLVDADVLMREAEVLLDENQWALRQSLRGLE